MALAPLPPELWERICSYLPDNEVLRLLSLNSAFLCCALAIRYETFDIRPRPNLKALFRPLRSPYISGKVHTLILSNDIDVVLPSIATLLVPVCILNQLHKRQRKSIEDSIRHLTGVSCAVVLYHHSTNLCYSHSYFGLAWKTFSQSLIVLDLHLEAKGLHHFSCLDPSLVCPCIRTLKLTIRLSSSDGMDQAGFDNAMQRLFALIASSSLVELKFAECELVHFNPSPLHDSFANLKKIVISDCNSFPFDIVRLLHNNVQTLEELRLYESYQNRDGRVNWSTLTLPCYNVQRFVLQMSVFFEHRDTVLPQLANYRQLGSFELVEPVGDWGFPFPLAMYQRMYKELLGTLSMNCPHLTRLALPFHQLNRPFFLHVVAALPNLQNLILRGPPPIFMETVTKDFVGRFPNNFPEYDLHEVQLTFESVGAALSNVKSDQNSTFEGTDVFNRVVQCGTLEFKEKQPRWPE